MKLIYFLLSMLIFYVLFQVFWPLILVFGLLLVGFIAYINYKAKKALKEAENYYQSEEENTQTFQYQTYENTNDSGIEKPIHSGSVIDAEYTERSQNDDRN